MRRLKMWLVQRFLPAWTKDSLLRENEALREEIDRLKAESDRLNAYVDGMEAGVRAQRRIVIRNEVHKG